MFREEEYVNADEPYLCLEAAKDSCTWAGCMYQRKTGGFDLFYDHANSEFKPLAVDKITKLRHLSQADGGVVFVTHLIQDASQKKLLEHATQQLLEWIATTIGS